MTNMKEAKQKKFSKIVSKCDLAISVFPLECIGLNIRALSIILNRWGSTGIGSKYLVGMLELAFLSVGCLIRGDFRDLLNMVYTKSKGCFKTNPVRYERSRLLWNLNDKILELCDREGSTFDKSKLLDLRNVEEYSERELGEFSKADVRLRKFNFFKDKLRLFSNQTWIGGKWRHIFELHVNSIRKEWRGIIKCCLLNLFPNPGEGLFYGDKCVIDQLKNITTAIKLHCPDSLAGIGSYLIDLHQLGGYNTVYNEIPELFNEWKESQYLHMDSWKDVVSKKAGLVKKFHRAIRSVVQEWGVDNSKFQLPPDLLQFITDRGGWCVRGASTLEPVSVSYNVVSENGYSPTRSERLTDKESTAMSYSSSELYDYVMKSDGTKEESFPFQKADEPAKARIVVNHDIRSYIRVCYLDYFIGQSPDWTSLDKGTSGTAGVYESMMKLIGLDDVFGLSLDFSGWDSSVNVSFVQTVVDEFSRIISRKLRESGLVDIANQVQEISGKERCSLYNMEYVFPDGSKLGRKGGFLSSGYKWTAVANTIINRALFKMCVDELQLDRQIVKSYHQGDDIAVMARCRSLNDAKDLCSSISEFVSQLNYVINPLKTSISSTGVEFLRLWVTSDAVFGYPGRMLRTILWKKPQGGGGSFTSWLESIRELCESSAMAYRRGMEDIGSLVRRAVFNCIPSKVKAIDRVRLIDWLSTPGTFGGGGCIGFVTEKRRHLYCRFVPRLEQNFSINIKGLTDHKGVNKLGKSSTFEERVLRCRLQSVMTNLVPIKNVPVVLHWDKVEEPSKCRKFLKSVQQDSRYGWATEVPPPLPTEMDGVGWWFSRVLGEHALAFGKDKYLSECNILPWECYISIRFKEYIRKYGSTLSRASVVWGEAERTPPPVDTTFEEFTMWKTRSEGAKRWNLLYCHGVVFGGAALRKFISGDLRNRANLIWET